MYNHVPLVSLHGLKKKRQSHDQIFVDHTGEQKFDKVDKISNVELAKNELKLLYLQIGFQGRVLQYLNTSEVNASLNSFMGSFIVSLMLRDYVA